MSAMLDSEEEILKVIQGEFKVTWDWIGEGYHGDYDPSDPEDEALLRFYCYRKNNGQWEEIDFTSYCTRVSRTTPPETLKVLSKPIFSALEKNLKPEQYTASRTLERELEKLSWMTGGTT